MFNVGAYCLLRCLCRPYCTTNFWGDHGATPWDCTKQLQQVVDELGFAGQVVPTSAETIYTNLVMQRERG